MAAARSEALDPGHAAGVSGGALQTSLSMPAFARPDCPRPALLRGRGRLPTEPRSSSRRQRQLGDPSVHLLEGPRPRPPGPRGSSAGALRSPGRHGSAGVRAPSPAAPAASESRADDEPHKFASCFVSSIVLGAISDHVHEDEFVIECLPDDDDDDAASACGDEGAGTDVVEAGPAPGPRAQWEPLRLGEALPPCLAIWPEEADAPVRKAAMAAAAAEAAALAAAAAAAQRSTGQHDVPESISPRTAGGGSLSFSSTSGEWEHEHEGALDDFEEVRSLCSDDAGLEEEHSTYAVNIIHKAFAEARATVDAQQPEEEPETTCEEAEAGGSVIEDAETTNEDLALDFACGVLDLGIAACSESGLGELAAVAAAATAQEPRPSAPWGSTTKRSASESVLERLRAEFPLACARGGCAGAAGATEPAAASATLAAPWGSASVPDPAAPTATPAPPTPSSKAKRRVVIGGVVRSPAGSPAEGAPTTDGGTRPSQPGGLSRSRLASASTPALALDLGEDASGKSKWSTGASTQQSACSPGLQASPSLGALKVTKKQQNAQAKASSWRAFGLPGEASFEPSWARKHASSASNLPMGGGSVAFNLRMARLTALQGPSWEGAL